MFRRDWKFTLSPARQRWGWIYLLLYLLVFPRLNAWCQKLAFGEGEILVAEANVAYYAILFALALPIFWRMLKEDLAGLWDWLPENLCGLALGQVGGVILRSLLRLLPFPVEDPIPIQYAQEFLMAPGPTLTLILLLIPLVEEIVFRGFLYGRLREYGKGLAAVLVTVGYALFLVWRYAWDFGDPRYLLLTALYLPFSAGLTLCRENGGSVWSCVVLHAGLNGFLLLSAL